MIQSDILSRQTHRTLGELVELGRAHGANLSGDRAVVRLVRDHGHLVVLRDRREDQCLGDAMTVGGLGGRRQERVGIRSPILELFMLLGSALATQVKGRRRRHEQWAGARREVARLGLVVLAVDGAGLRGDGGILAGLLRHMRRGAVGVDGREIGAQRGSMSSAKPGGLWSVAVSRRAAPGVARAVGRLGVLHRSSMNSRGRHARLGVQALGATESHAVGRGHLRILVRL
jgi:hypothetical protein